MIEILGMMCAIFICSCGTICIVFELFHLFALLTFKGKIRRIDEFIGLVDEDYKKMCDEYIEARAETK